MLDGMVLPLTHKQIDLKEETVDVEIDVMEMDSPLEDVDYHILRALFHIGTKFRSADGFWIPASSTAKWLKANNYSMKSIDIGKRMKALGFTLIKRLGEAKYRWVNRKKLMALIKNYNDVGISMEAMTNSYEEIKLAVFECLLTDGDISELEFDIETIKKAVREFNALEREDAEGWVKAMTDG